MILILIIIIILVFAYKINKHKIKGFIGERIVATTLRKLPVNEYRVFNNISLKTDRDSSQIDHVIVSIYGVFVIETKRYIGWIHGNEKSQYWTQSIFKKKKKFRNPIKQNWSHIFALKESLSYYKDVKYHNIVVFTGNGKLKNITSKTPVVYRRQLIRTIKANSKSVNLDVEQVNSIAVRLDDLVIQGRGTKKKHIAQTKKHVAESRKKEKQLICPRCDGSLIVRKGRYGKFYGCSNYPKCRFTMPFKKKWINLF